MDTRMVMVEDQIYTLRYTWEMQETKNRSLRLGDQILRISVIIAAANFMTT